MTQLDRRREPYPWTWEPAAGVLTTLAGLAVGAVQGGRAVANLLTGAGWHLPSTAAAWITSLPAVLAGDSAAGLDSPPPGLAGPVLLGWAIVTTAAVLLGTVGTAGFTAWQRWGTGAIAGVASATEVRNTLGVRRLRRSAPLIRPDLHATRGRRPRR